MHGGGVRGGLAPGGEGQAVALAVALALPGVRGRRATGRSAGGAKPATGDDRRGASAVRALSPAG